MLKTQFREAAGAGPGSEGQSVAGAASVDDWLSLRAGGGAPRPDLLRASIAILKRLRSEADTGEADRFLAEPALIAVLCDGAATKPETAADEWSLAVVAAPALRSARAYDEQCAVIHHLHELKSKWSVGSADEFGRVALGNPDYAEAVFKALMSRAAPELATKAWLALQSAELLPREVMLNGAITLSKRLKADGRADDAARFLADPAVTVEFGRSRTVPADAAAGDWALAAAALPHFRGARAYDAQCVAIQRLRMLRIEHEVGSDEEFDQVVLGKPEQVRDVMRALMSRAAPKLASDAWFALRGVAAVPRDDKLGGAFAVFKRLRSEGLAEEAAAFISDPGMVGEICRDDQTTPETAPAEWSLAASALPVLRSARDYDAQCLVIRRLDVLRSEHAQGSAEEFDRVCLGRHDRSTDVLGALMSRAGSLEAMGAWSALRMTEAAPRSALLEAGLKLFKRLRSEGLEIEANQFVADVLDWAKQFEELDHDIALAQRGVEEVKQTGPNVQNADWVSVVPPELRWRVASQWISAQLASIDASISASVRQAEALQDLLGQIEYAAGSLLDERQMFAMEATIELDDVIGSLKATRGTSRRVMGSARLFNDAVEDEAGVSEPEREPLKVPRTEWRSANAKIATHVFEQQGLQAALDYIARFTLVEDRSSVLAEFARAIQQTAPDAAIRTLWIAYGTAPSRQRAERIASIMFQIGNLTDTSQLLTMAPELSRTGFATEMKSTVAMFRNGVAMEPPSRSEQSRGPLRLGYVASSSLPFQSMGYTIRTHQVLRAVTRAGVDTICFTRPGYPWDRPFALPEDAEVKPLNDIEGVKYVHTPPSEIEDGGARAIEIAADQLAKLFVEHKVTIVQAASNSRNALPALVAARKVGLPFVYEVRGLWELTAASRNPGWEATERFKFDRDLEIMVALNADRVLTITEGVAEELLEREVPQSHMSLLRNAVDPDEFAPREKNLELAASLGLAEDDFVIVYAGSCVYYEGLDDLVLSVEHLKARGVPVRLIMVGIGETLEQLKSLTHERQLNDRITFVGRVPADKVTDYLSLADVVALPRKPFKVCQIVSPLKPFEAMSMAKTVVLSDLRVLREIVEEGVTGMFCKPADPADLADVLESLHRDPELRRRLGAAARDWIVEHRSWAEAARHLQAVYGQIRAQGPSAG